MKNNYQSPLNRFLRLAFAVLVLLTVRASLSEVSGQPVCGNCANPACPATSGYANKSAALGGSGPAPAWKYYSPALPPGTGTFTNCAKVKTDINGQLGLVQYIQIKGASPSTVIGPVAASRTYQLFAISGGQCTGSAIPATIPNDGASSTFNPAWVGLTPGTDYIICITTSVSSLPSGYTYQGFSIRAYGGVRTQGAFAFNCGSASATGTFYANGTTGQAGTLNVPITGASAGYVTINVSGTGFTGSATVNLANGQTSVSVPITYDGSGSAGGRVLTVTSSRGTGTCSPNVNVLAVNAKFSFNCGSGSATGTYTANGTAGQTGSLTVPITGATAGVATFNVSGGGFTGSLSTNITAGQTSVAIPISYNGSGTAGNRLVAVTSTQATGNCSVSIPVQQPGAAFTYNCGASSASGTYIANGAAGQSGFLTLGLNTTTAGAASFTVTGTGFSGTLSTVLGSGQTSVNIPITYTGAGAAGTRALSISSTPSGGTCSVNATVLAPNTAGAFAFTCPAVLSVVGQFKASGIGGQTGIVTVPITTNTAGDVTLTISGGGFSGTKSTSIAAGQSSVTMLVSFDGSGSAGNRSVSVTSAQGTGSCATAIPVDGLFAFACASFNTGSTFIANGLAQTGSLVVPVSNASAGVTTVSVSGSGFSGSVSTTLTNGQNFITIPVTFDGSGPVGSRAVTVTSTQATGSCAANVRVVDPALNNCDFVVGSPVSFSIHSNQTAPGYTTEYVLVDQAGVIQYRTATLPFAGVVAGSYNGYAVNYTGTAPTLTPGTSLTAIVGTCTGLSNALPVKVCPAYLFNCGNATYTGNFIANGTTQTGAVTISLLEALPVSTTFTVSGTGFSGTLPVSLTAGQTSVTIPISYNGSGTGGTIPLTITSPNGVGSCGLSVDVLPPPPASPFTFVCGSAVVNNTFVADGSQQYGSVTVPITGASAGTVDFNISSSSGFDGELLSTVLSSTTTSVTVPLFFDGSGTAGVRSFTVSSPSATAVCSVTVLVTGPPAVTITSPANGTTITTTTPVISGTATPNAVVILTGGPGSTGGPISVTASPTGSYSATGFTFPAGPNSITAIATNENNGTSPPAVSSFTVVSCPTPSVGGTAGYGGTSPLCSTANAGIISLTGQTGSVIRWETSTDGGSTFSPVANTSTTLAFSNAANNQQYRAVVSNGAGCAPANSSPVTLTTSAAACATVVSCDYAIPGILK